MKKSLRVIIYLMIVVCVAGGVYLWSLGNGNEEVLGGLNPEKYDVEVSCSAVDGNLLICNAGNDTYLFLDGTKVYLQKTKTEITEEGDEETKVSYKSSSFEKLEKKFSDEGEALLHMWLTKTGKVRAIMIVENSFENNNTSLSNLDGLDPADYTLSSVILKMNKDGMVLAPMGYTDVEKDKFEEFIKTYKYAKGVKFYRETMTTTVDADGSRHKNIRYNKAAYREIRDNLGKGINGYIWLDKYGRVSSVMVLEEKVVLE